MKQKTDATLIREHHPLAIERRLQNPVKTQFVSDAILGGIDGCVTTFAIVSGAVGAGFSASVALVLGFANLFADGFSMAVSNYESIKAQQEYADNIRQTEEEHINKVPEGEIEEIRQIFQNKGFSADILEEIVNTIICDRRLWVETMLTEEHGIQKVTSTPFKPALITFTAFVIVGAIPLIPFLAPITNMQHQFILSTCFAALTFFAIGMLKSIAFHKPVFVSGLSTLLTGGTAAALAFATGYLLREFITTA